MDAQGPVSWGLRFRLFSALAYWGWHSHQWAYPARAFTSDFWSREQSSTWGPPDVSVWWPFPFGWSVLPEERGPSVFFWGGGGRQWLKLGCQQRRGNVGLRLLVSRPLQSSAWDSRIQCLPGLPSPELTLSLCLANRMQGPHFLTHRLTNNPVFHLHPGLPLPDAPPFPPPHIWSLCRQLVACRLPHHRILFLCFLWSVDSLACFPSSEICWHLLSVMLLLDSLSLWVYTFWMYLLLLQGGCRKGRKQVNSRW